MEQGSKGAPEPAAAATGEQHPPAAAAEPASSSSRSNSASEQEAPAPKAPRCLADCVWWEDQACICEETWGPKPGVREADASNPEI